MNNTKVLFTIILLLFVGIIGILVFQHWKISQKNKVEELKEKNSSICTKDNSCKLRAPGSAFKCDKDGKYDRYGDYWCECTINCEVNIQVNIQG